MNNSLKKKFTFGLLCVSIIPVLILFALHLKSSYEFYNEQTKTIASGEIDKAVYQADTVFKEIDDLVTSLIFSQYESEYFIRSMSVQEEENSSLSAIDRLKNYRKFTYICSNLIRNNKYVEGVYLINRSGYTYSYTKSKDFYLENNYKDSQWYREITLENIYQAMMFWQPYDDAGKEKYFIEVRPVSDEAGNKISYIAVVCNTEFIEEMDDAILDDAAAILGEGGERIYEIAGKIDLDSSELSKVQEQSEGFIETGSGGYIFRSLGINGWKIISRYDVEELGVLYRENTRNLILIIAGCIVFITLSAVVIEKHFIEPIVRLSVTMLRVPENEMRVDSVYKGRKDEIGILYKEFDRMISQIHELIQERYISQIHLLKEKLNGLMSQINSHFLFNTLENINCLADMEGDQRIALMSKSLGDMLHYSMDFEKTEETLEAEIENIRRYTEIQEIRFGNEIQVTEEIPDALRRCAVLKFMLQPIVENAIEHGMIDIENGWYIVIRAVKEGQGLLVQIENGGENIPVENLQALRQRISGVTRHLDEKPDTGLKQGHSIGLENIQRRIQLVYSDKYGLDIANIEGGGVLVEIRLPLKYTLGGEDNRDLYVYSD